MSSWKNRLTGHEVVEAPEDRTGQDPVVLEGRLARLPPAQPCLECPSHDAAGKLRLIAPQLGKLAFESGSADAALFVCRLCGGRWGEPLL